MNYNAKLGRTFASAPSGSSIDTSKRLAALSFRRREGTLQRFIQSFGDGRFEFSGPGLSSGSIS